MLMTSSLLLLNSINSEMQETLAEVQTASWCQVWQSWCSGRVWGHPVWDPGRCQHEHFCLSSSKQPLQVHLWCWLFPIHSPILPSSHQEDRQLAFDTTTCLRWGFSEATCTATNHDNTPHVTVSIRTQSQRPVCNVRCHPLNVWQCFATAIVLVLLSILDVG